MARKTKGNWLAEGLKLLVEEGADYLTIDTLTSRLGVTKGSFYHHFRNYQDFKEQLLASFEEESTGRIILFLEQETRPEKKLAGLMEITTSHPPVIEVAMRAWALQDHEVYRCQERIDQHRIAYMTNVLVELTGEEQQAVTLSRLLYAVYVGSQHILPPIQGPDLMRLYQQIQCFYLPVSEKDAHSLSVHQQESGVSTPEMSGMLPYRFEKGR